MAPVAKPRVKIAPERRGLTKVWNISDWPATSVAMQSVMVLGTTVHPGRAVEVKKEDLKRAHKTMKDRDAGLIHIGDHPPEEYLQAMQRRKRLRLPPGAANHGAAKRAQDAKEAEAAEESAAKKAEAMTLKKVEAVKKPAEPAKPTSPMRPATPAAPMAPKMEAKDGEKSSGKKKK